MFMSFIVILICFQSVSYIMDILYSCDYKTIYNFLYNCFYSCINSLFHYIFSNIFLFIECLVIANIANWLLTQDWFKVLLGLFMRYLNIFFIRYNWVFLSLSKSCVWLAKLLLALAYIKVRYPLATNVYLSLYFSVLVFIIFNLSIYNLMLFTVINLCSLGIVCVLYTCNGAKDINIWRWLLILLFLSIALICTLSLIFPFIFKTNGNNNNGPSTDNNSGGPPQKKGPTPPSGEETIGDPPRKKRKYTSLKGMSEEEKKAHRRQKDAERVKKYRKENPVFKERRKAQWKKDKNDPEKKYMKNKVNQGKKDVKTTLSIEIRWIKGFLITIKKLRKHRKKMSAWLKLERIIMIIMQNQGRCWVMMVLQSMIT